MKSYGVCLSPTGLDREQMDSSGQDWEEEGGIELMDTDNNVVTVGGRGLEKVEEVIGGINGNRRKYNF